MPANSSLRDTVHAGVWWKERTILGCPNLRIQSTNKLEQLKARRSRAIATFLREQPGGRDARDSRRDASATVNRCGASLRRADEGVCPHGCGSYVQRWQRSDVGTL